MPKVLVGGGSGLVGTRLTKMLLEAGYAVAHLSRNPNGNKAVPSFKWDISAQTIDEKALVGTDIVINLAGAGIADKRWTKARKRVIIESRAGSNQLLANAIGRQQEKPRIFISASAIGYYGNRGDEHLREDALPGIGFLSESTQAWEGSLEPIRATGVPTYAIRIGLVLSLQAKSVKNLLLPIRFGFSAYFGNGKQWMSWVHIDDLCRLFLHLIETPGLEEGIYNGTAPEPERMKAFMQTMGHAWGKTTISLPIPAFVMRIAMGEMADILLDSTRTDPGKNLASGFQYHYPTLLKALTDIRNRRV